MWYLKTFLIFFFLSNRRIFFFFPHRLFWSYWLLNMTSMQIEGNRRIGKGFTISAVVFACLALSLAAVASLYVEGPFHVSLSSGWVSQFSFLPYAGPALCGPASSFFAVVCVVESRFHARGSTAYNRWPRTCMPMAGTLTPTRLKRTQATCTWWGTPPTCAR